MIDLASRIDGIQGFRAWFISIDIVSGNPESSSQRKLLQAYLCPNCRPSDPRLGHWTAMRDMDSHPVSCAS